MTFPYQPGILGAEGIHARQLRSYTISIVRQWRKLQIREVLVRISGLVTAALVSFIPRKLSLCFLSSIFQH